VKKLIGAVLVSFLVVASTHAKDRLIVGSPNWDDGTPYTITLAPNTPGQTIPIYITPGAGLSSVSHVGSLDFAIQVGNGSSGPKISGVDLLGTAASPTIFYGANDPSYTWIDWPPVWPDWKAELETMVLAPTPKTVTNNGVLAYVTVDTTGLVGTGPWSLKLDATSSFKTLLYGYEGGPLTDLNPDFRNASLTVVPEPASWAMLLGLLPAAPAILWFRSRRKTRA
jgi:hypothetical protein